MVVGGDQGATASPSAPGLGFILSYRESALIRKFTQSRVHCLNEDEDNSGRIGRRGQKQISQMVPLVNER